MLTLPRAILFDMDGTLTQPMLDFPAIKREMGIGDQPILEALAALPPVQRQPALAILQRHEQTAARNARLNDGCRELLDWLHLNNVASAIITRNSRISATTICTTHNLHVDLLITRDDDLPHKPHPAPLLFACQHLGITPQQAWMVGDAEFDILAGHAAGITTIWISHQHPRDFAACPTRTLTSLIDLLHLLQSLL